MSCFASKSSEEWSQAGEQKEPLYSMIHPSAEYFLWPEQSGFSGGCSHPSPPHTPLPSVEHSCFGVVLKGGKKITRWQELGNTNFSNRSCCFGWWFLCRRIGSAWSVPTKMFLCQWHTQLEIVFAIGSIYGNSSVCVRCELRAWSIVHYQSYWRLFKEWEVHVFFPTM